MKPNIDQRQAYAEVVLGKTVGSGTAGIGIPV
jgi:hypothetical protein